MSKNLMLEYKPNPVYWWGCSGMEEHLKTAIKCLDDSLNEKAPSVSPEEAL